MTSTAMARKAENKPKFKPKMENYKTSLGYEGLALKNTDENLSIEELKRKYAR
ncbi:hypothetical protein JYB87_02685 [Shewanella avicenniae]|uniref:Uncharacterized protein n=1 Tax=Shewanella avicenniae TaxID=2814294 RepID=A0ABX7QRV4_9GAMM|nr:hypothetical protein [Shewanella avicenniae]QSX34172.1 hypothetical protein JYB87_02685 [Shewanella avicenniae]